MEPRWTRWGGERQTPAPSAGNIIAAPSVEELMPLQPLAAVLSTSSLQRRRASSLHRASAAPNSLGSTGRITGTAIPFDTPYAVGGFLEVCKRGCFSDSLATDDARALFNSDPGRVLGRQQSGTLKVWESQAGLEFEIDAPSAVWAQDLLVSMRRHDIDGSGTAFYISQHHWEQRGNDRIRVVETARLVYITVEAFATAGRAQAEVQEQVATAQRIGFAQGRLVGEANLRFHVESARHAGYKRGLLATGKRKRVGHSRQGASK